MTLNELKIEAHGDRWVVVNKPAGMLAHTVGGDETDVIQQLEKKLKDDPIFAEACNYDPQYELHPIHRLDREVSGLMLVALDKKTSNYLHSQFQERSIDKAYYALVQLEGKELEQEGDWTWKLTKKAEGRSKPAGFSKYRVPCHTNFTILKKNEEYALLSLVPHTGRKHQLRRHCALAGTPILGDPRYGNEHTKGLQLMSYRLCFKDPKTEKIHKIEIETQLDTDLLVNL